MGRSASRAAYGERQTQPRIPRPAPPTRRRSASGARRDARRASPPHHDADASAASSLERERERRSSNESVGDRRRTHQRARTSWRRHRKRCLRAPRQAHHGLDGVALALALARCDRRVGRLHRQLGRLVVVVLAADRVLELPHTAPHRASDLREPLGPEEKQRQQEQQDDLPRADVRHGLRVAVWTARRGKDDRQDDTKEAAPGAGRRGRRRFLRAGASDCGRSRAPRRGRGHRGPYAPGTRRSAGRDRGAGANGLAVAADVSRREQVAELVDATVERFGRIDTYVANAMVTVYAEAHRLEDEELRRVFDVNFFGSVYGYWTALPHLCESHGTFIQIASAFPTAVSHCRRRTARPRPPCAPSSRARESNNGKNTQTSTSA